MITTLGKEQIANFVLGIMQKMEIRIDNVVEDIPFYFDGIENDYIVFKGLVQEGLAGNIDRIRLINNDDNVFAERFDDIDKPLDRFLILEFKYKITEVIL